MIVSLSAMDLVQYIHTKVKLTDEEGAAIDAAFKQEYYPKGTALVQPDNRSQKVYFIEKGMLRTFYNKDGKDITHFFFDENSFTMSVDTVYFNNPDPYGREVLQNATLRVIHFKEFNALFSGMAVFKEFAFMVAIEYLKKFSDKLFSVQFQTAEQRYRFMMASYPDILSRAPLGHIASYLGITQQTLSVIRAQR